MSSTKRWSYQQLTAHTEERIKRALEEARQESDGERAFRHRCIALGVLDLWVTLTSGWQQTGDRERLLGLILNSGFGAAAPQENRAQ